MKNWFKTIVTKIAAALGLQLQEKTETTNDYNNIDDISLTAAIANRLTTLTMLDSNISVEGSSLRAKYIDKFTQDFVNDKLAAACQVALGTGDCLMKPYVSNGTVGVDIIDNYRFRVCESAGNSIRACIILADELPKDSNGNVYQRYETQRLKEINGLSVLFIYQNAYKNDKPCSLTEVPAWADIHPESYIPNVKSIGFGRIKCPTVNRQNVNSVQGVKITYGLEKVMDNAVDAYNRFNEEYELKEARVFVDKQLTKQKAVTKSDGTIQYDTDIMSNMKDKLFVKVNSYQDKYNTDLIQEYSPDIRTDSLISGIEQNFKMVELLAGLSNGILTNPTTNFATATEMKASLQLTFAFMTKFRKQIQKGVEDMLYFVDVLCNANNVNPMGGWKTKFDWSSSYIENIQEQFNRLMQAESIRAVSKSEVRSWVMDEEAEQAQVRVAEIAATEPKTDFANEV